MTSNEPSPTTVASRRGRQRRRRPTLYAARLGALVLTAAALAISAFSVQAGGPEPAVVKGMPRAWYTSEGFERAAGSKGLDLRQISGVLGKLMTHGHEFQKREFRPRRLPFSSNVPIYGGAPASNLPSQATDAWSPSISLTSHWPDVPAPIHWAMLPDGRLTYSGRFVTYNLTLPALGTATPASIEAQPQVLPLEFGTLTQYPEVSIIDTLFCTSGTLMSDGTLFLAGGTRHAFVGDQVYQLGLNQALRYTGAAWEALPDMQGTTNLPEANRWYPTSTRLHDGRILVLGGYDFVQPWSVRNLSSEIYDPVSKSWTVVNPNGSLPPQVFSWMYSHVFQLPRLTPGGEDVLAIGDVGVPGFMKTNGAWRLSANRRPGSQDPAEAHVNLGTTSPLPWRVADGEWGYANGSVIMAGGQYATETPTKIDVYDPVSDQWKFRRDMGVYRSHPASVVLPDGRILILGGEDYGSSAGLGRVQYVDPRGGFTLEWGTEEYPEVRGYHNVAALLPDGRVVFGSGNQDYTRGELPSIRFYSPSYMSQARPEITAHQPVLGYNGQGWVTWSGAKAPAEIVLMGLSSMTHSFDMSQRYIQVPITQSGVYQGQNYSLFQTPADGRIAPPGYYMLFILDENQVPSIAKMVQIQ